MTASSGRRPEMAPLSAEPEMTGLSGGVGDDRSMGGSRGRRYPQRLERETDRSYLADRGTTPSQQVETATSAERWQVRDDSPHSGRGERRRPPECGNGE